MIQYSISISQDIEKIYGFNPETKQSTLLRENTWTGLMDLSIGEVHVSPYSLENYIAVMEHLEQSGKITAVKLDNIQLALLSIRSVRK